MTGRSQKTGIPEVPRISRRDVLRFGLYGLLMLESITRGRKEEKLLSKSL